MSRANCSRPSASPKSATMQTSKRSRSRRTGSATVGIVHPLHFDEGTTGGLGRSVRRLRDHPAVPATGPAGAGSRTERGEGQDAHAAGESEAAAAVDTRHTGAPQLGAWQRLRSWRYHGVYQAVPQRWRDGVAGDRAGHCAGSAGLDPRPIGAARSSSKGLYGPTDYPYHKEEKMVPLNKVDEVTVSEVLADLNVLAEKAS